MGSYRFDRADYYARLHRHDECLAEAIVQRRRAHAPYSSHHDYWSWPAGARLGERAYRVRDAVAASEAIALRELEGKLSGIGLADIWPVLREICHDVALYVGGGVLAGGVIGAGVGMLVFGAGILPGATAGALVGAQAGNLLLGFFGLKSVVGFMADVQRRPKRQARCCVKANSSSAKPKAARGLGNCRPNAQVVRHIKNKSRACGGGLNMMWLVMAYHRGKSASMDSTRSARFCSMQRTGRAIRQRTWISGRRR
jgi:hypothetical protein